MKALLVLSVLVIATNAHPQHLYQGISVRAGPIETLINATIMKIIDSLPTMIEVSDLNVAFPTEGALTGSANITDLQITGHKGLKFTNLKVNIFSLSLQFAIELPNLNIYSQYGADVLLGDLIPLYGDGSINVHLSNLTIQGTGKAKLTNGLSVSNVTAGILLDQSTTFDIHGLFNNEAFSNIVSSILNENVARFLDDHYDLISGIISPLAQTIINSILGGSSQTLNEVDAEVPLY